MVGASLSASTVTVKAHLVSPHGFEATQMTVVTPSGNAEPDGGVQTTATLESALSVAVGGGQDTAVVVVVAPQSQTVRLVGHWQRV